MNFYPVPPCRVADTRPGHGFSGQYGPPSLAANSTRSFDMSLTCSLAFGCTGVLAEFHGCAARAVELSDDLGSRLGTTIRVDAEFSTWQGGGESGYCSSGG